MATADKTRKTKSQEPKVDPSKEAPKAATTEEVTPKPDFPAAGPHARPELNDPWKTPGCGMLTEPGDGTMAPGG